MADGTNHLKLWPEKDGVAANWREKWLSPNSTSFQRYTLFSLTMLLLYGLIMPIRAAFAPSDDRGGWIAFDTLSLIVFVVDLIIRWNAGIIDKANGTVTFDRARRIPHYLKGWFLFDLAAAISSFAMLILGGNGTLDDDDNDRRLELIYLMSIPKMTRMYFLMTSLQKNSCLSPNIGMAIRIFLSVVVTAQLLGCGWFMMATLFYEECDDLYTEGLPPFMIVNGQNLTASEYIASECPWIYRNDFAELSDSRQYIASMYWALTTLTTVGYGDISARTIAEHIYSMLVQIVGVSWYGYILTNWTAVLTNFERKTHEPRSKLHGQDALSKLTEEVSNEVEKFSRDVRLPESLATRVEGCFGNALDRDAQESLRSIVLPYVQAKKIQWLDKQDNDFFADFMTKAEPRSFTGGEILYERGSEAAEIFFIASGSVILTIGAEDLGSLGPGDVAGLIGLVGNAGEHKITAMAGKDGADCLMLSRTNFEALQSTNSKEMRGLESAAETLAQSVFSSNENLREDLMPAGVKEEARISGDQALEGGEASGTP